jgi:O-methyltransferase
MINGVNTNMKLSRGARGRRTLAKIVHRIRRSVSRTPNPIRPWIDDRDFNLLMSQVHGRTLVDRVRCFMLYQYARHIGQLQGDVAEIGVYQGGTARLLAKTLDRSQKTIHLFDTFAGMPSTDPGRDLHRSGDFADTSLEAVQAYLADCTNVRFYQGFFPATSAPIMDMTFALVHIDVDIYRSVLDCCQFFYPRMERGGIMIFDDYGFTSCPGAKAAVDAFFASNSEAPCYLPTGQCVVIRH